MESNQFVERRLCVFQVAQIKAFGEPLIGRRKQLARRDALTLPRSAMSTSFRRT